MEKKMCSILRVLTHQFPMMAKKCSPMLTMYPYSHTSSNKFAPFNSLYKASKNTPQNSMCDHQITVLAPNGYEQLGPMEEKSTNHEIRSPECFNDYLVVKVGVLLSQASSKTASIHFQTILFPKNKPKLKLKRTPTRTTYKNHQPFHLSCHFVGELVDSTLRPLDPKRCKANFTRHSTKAATRKAASRKFHGRAGKKKKQWNGVPGSVK